MQNRRATQLFPKIHTAKTSSDGIILMLKMQRQTPLAIELAVHLARGKWSLYLKFWKTAKGIPDSQH